MAGKVQIKGSELGGPTIILPQKCLSEVTGEKKFGDILFLIADKRQVVSGILGRRGGGDPNIYI